MGNGKSSEEVEKVGYRVLGVQPNSPAALGGLVSFFDFIVAANGVPLRSLDFTFVELIKASEDKPLPLTVYNCKSHSLREVILVPHRNWPGKGMLGVVIRFDSYHEAEEHICHILEVEPNSPAELAGLQSNTDYLLGTAELAFKNTDDLFAVLQANLEKPIEFYVYNTVTDEVRVSVLMPSEHWGGEGILGASVAHGYLHTFPVACCQTLGRSSEVFATLPSMSQSPFGHNSGMVSLPQPPEILKEPIIDTSAIVRNPADASDVLLPQTDLPLPPIQTRSLDIDVATQSTMAVPEDSLSHSSAELNNRMASFFNSSEVSHQ